MGPRFHSYDLWAGIPRTIALRTIVLGTMASRIVGLGARIFETTNLGTAALGIKLPRNMIRVAMAFESILPRTMTVGTMVLGTLVLGSMALGAMIRGTMTTWTISPRDHGP